MGHALANLTEIENHHRFNVDCVEVVSPRNTRPELLEKKRLYFEEGAEEVWICGEDGSMSFFLASNPNEEADASALCPGFPSQLSTDL